MLDKITWSDFFTVAAIIVAAYYLVVGMICYRKEVVRFLLRGKGRKDRTPASEGVQSEGQTDGEQLQASFDGLEKIVSGVDGVLVKAGKEADKTALLEQLRERLANYAGLRQPAFRTAINHYIIQHAKEICGAGFSDQELEAAWEPLLR